VHEHAAHDPELIIVVTAKLHVQSSRQAFLTGFLGTLSQAPCRIVLRRHEAGKRIG
jgi:hypothetical protein